MRVLGNLSMIFDGDLKYVNTGIIKIAVEIFDLYKKSSPVCTAIARLFLNISIVPNYSKACIKDGVVPILLKSLYIYSDTEIADRILYGIENIVEHETGRKACINSNGIPIIINALNFNKKSCSICRCIIKILANISMDAKGRELCIKYGAIKSIIEAVKAH